jgi:hypothetical protein
MTIFVLSINKEVNSMKTISQIQQEVLATAQVTLDELQASIEKFWEEGWERNEEAKRTCQASKWYADNISRVIRDYASYKKPVRENPVRRICKPTSISRGRCG